MKYLSGAGLTYLWKKITALINTKEPIIKKNTAFNKNFGNAAGTVCQGNDVRLSDTRTPKAHTHTKSQITDFPASLKNPNALSLKLNGELLMYDGSSAKTFSIDISNTNLLINGDFQFWQRGTTFNIIGNESFHYTSDRWCIYASTGQIIKIDKVSGGIQVNGASVIMQRLEIPLENGKKYMLSANISESIRSMEITGGTYTENSYFKYNKSGSIERIQVKISGITIISYVLLSVGCEIPINSPRPYAEELLLCQRYYQRIAYYQRTTIGYNIISVPYFCNMRIAPTAKKISIDMYGNNNKETHTYYTNLEQLQSYRLKDINAWLMVKPITSITTDSNILCELDLDSEIY